MSNQPRSSVRLLMVRHFRWTVGLIAVMVVAAGCSGTAAPSAGQPGSQVTLSDSSPASLEETGVSVDSVPSTTATDAGACFQTDIEALASEAVAAAGLADPDVTWNERELGTQFTSRIVSADELADTLGYWCWWSATQFGDFGARLVVAAWAGDRVALVIQSSDVPEGGFGESVTLDVGLLGVLGGEWVGESIWAAELPGDESLILATWNTSNLGLLAKSWIASEHSDLGDDGGDPVADVGDRPPGLDLASWAASVLEEAGARNVFLAEDPGGGSVAVLSLVSPTGDSLHVTVGPNGSYRSSDFLPHGWLDTRDVDGVVVSLVEAVDDFPVSAARFLCDELVWTFEADTGGVDETFEYVKSVVEIGCD